MSYWVPFVPMSNEERVWRSAGYYLLAQKDIWYDVVPNDHGDMVPGPHRQAVVICFKNASDLRSGK